MGVDFINCLKRFLAVSLAVVAFVFSSVGAFAFDMSPLEKYIVSDSDEITLFGTFITSTIDETDKQFLREFFKDFSGERTTTDKLYVIQNNVEFSFFRYPNDCKISIYKQSGFSDFSFSIPDSYDYKKSSGIYFRYDSKSKSFIRSNTSKTAMRSTFMDTLIWTNDSSVNMSASVAGEVYPDYNAVGFVDDGGLLSEPEPEKPTPPPVTPPKMPEIPKGDGEYVLYDTSVWNSFLSTIKGYIGSGTNTGIWIFAIILGITIAINIVKHFTKSK